MLFFKWCPRGYGADSVEEYGNIMRCLGFVQQDVCQVSGWGYSREADLQDKPSETGVGLVEGLEGFASSSPEQSNKSWLFGLDYLGDCIGIYMTFGVLYYIRLH